MIRSSILSLTLVLSLSAMYGQSKVDITLLPSPASGRHACFDIAVKSGDKTDINLAGQNYRLFYDAGKLEFIEDKSTYSFDEESYGRVYIHNTETKGIGFLSLSLDGRKLTDKTIVLRQGASWKNVMNVCFKETTEIPYDLTWAHRSRTSQFASAEVTLSEWSSAKTQKALEINELKDYTNVEDAIVQNSVGLSVYPNPVIDYINVEVINNKDARQLIIKDMIGREVVFDNIPQDQVATYDLINWPEGSYTIELLNADEERIATQKVIKVSK